MHTQSQLPLSLTGRAGVTVAAILVIAAACDLTITAGDGVEGPGTSRLTVSVTNVGTGFGSIDIAFPSGATVRDPCPAVLGPGESCSPFVLLRELPRFVTVEASPAPGSRFVDWTGGHCSGTSTDCQAPVESGTDQSVVVLTPRFDLVEGGS